MSFRERLKDAIFEEVPVRPRSGGWRRSSQFSWSNWTFGVWSLRTPRNHHRGLDLGPYEVVWTKRIPEGVRERKAAAAAIQRSGFKTKDDFLSTLGGDAQAMQDPLVKEMLRQLPEAWKCHDCGKTIGRNLDGEA